MPKLDRPRPVRYIAAACAAAVAIAVRMALDPWLGEHVPFAPLFLVILIVAGYAGRGPALLTTGLGGLGAAVLLLPPRYSLAIASRGHGLDLATYVIVGAGVAYLGGVLRAARRRAEAGLAIVARQGEHLRITLASIADAVIRADAWGHVVSLNPAAERLTGWPSAEAQGVPLADVFRVRDEGSQGTSAVRSQILTDRAGRERLVEVSVSEVRDRDQGVGSVLVLRDVQTARRAERDLIASERRLRIALDAARMAAWDWNPASDRLTLTDQATDVLGLVPGQPHDTSEKAFALIHPDDAEAHQRKVREVIASGCSYHTRFRIVRPVDGRVAWIEEWGQPDGGSPEHPARMIGVLADITDRVNAEEETRSARVRIEAILAASEVGTWEFDGVANLIRGDANLARMFGMSVEEAAAARVEQCLAKIHPDDQSYVAEAFQTALTRDQNYDPEYRIVLPGRPTRWVVARGQVRRDTSGKVVGLPGVVIDITKQKQAEAQLREVQSRLESTLSAAEVGSWEYDIVENRVYADRNLARLFGVTAEEAFGGPIESYIRGIHLEDRDRVEQAIGQAVTSGMTFEAAYRVIRYDGEVRSVIARGRVERDSEGRAMRLPGVVIDITAQRRAEDRFRESETKFRTLFETMDEGFCVVELIFDPSHRPVDYRFLEMNPAFEKHSGISDALGKTMRQIAPDHEAVWFETYGHVARTGESIRFENQAQALDDRWFDVYAFRLGGSDSSKVAILFNNITLRKQQEAERLRLEQDLRRIAADLSEADRRKDEFLATLAHELRNPLAPIRNGLEIMKLAGNDREAFDESRSLMERQVTHMVRLIDDLMDVSRITRNKMELRRERIDLGTVIRNAVETSRPLVEAAGHDLSVTLPDRPILVDADVVRLAQVFSNLLNNAAKYTERGGDITLSARREGSDAVVSVRDNGVGIPAEMLPQVFAMFTQVDRSLERSQGGLGIGLSLVKTLVEMHGGSVEARSEGHGLGSEFLVRLPVVLAAPGKAAAPRPGARSPGAGGPLRILVVDDNVGSATTLSRLLKLLGHEARTAYDGGEAIEVAEAYRPDLLLLDIGLPILNGYDVAREIRSRPWGGETTLIALTGWGQEGDRRRSHEAGIDDHLVKPVDPATLETLLATVKRQPATAPPSA